MSHGAKGEELIWQEFAVKAEALAWESEQLMATRQGKSVEEGAEVETNDLPKAGTERNALVRQRVNQNFFRKRILSAYKYRCCITGLNIQPLLVASHILPWADDVPNRLNPRNGLCLNALHDRAFDRHLMLIDEGFVVHFSSKVAANCSGADWLLSFEGKTLQLPKYFSPDSSFLKKHAEICRVL
jgi:putative restriction endonuclease